MAHTNGIENVWTLLMLAFIIGDLSPVEKEEHAPLRE